MLFAMRAVIAGLIAIVVTLTAGCGGGGGDLTGEAKVPEGYATFSDLGVTFAYPKGWKVTRVPPTGDEFPTIKITDPGETATPGALIQLVITPGAGKRFDSIVDQQRVIVETVNKGKIDSQDEIDVDGASKALRQHQTTPARPGSTDPVEVKATTLDIVTAGGDVVGFGAAAPQRGTPAFDPDVVADSFRLDGA